jgi:hypothetical protein
MRAALVAGSRAAKSGRRRYQFGSAIPPASLS